MRARYCSRACTSRLGDCACLSPCVGDGYAPLVLSSLRSSSPSVATLCVRWWGVRGGLLSYVYSLSLSLFLHSRVYLLSLTRGCLLALLPVSVFACFLRFFSLSLSTDSPSPLGRSSGFNLPLVPRGIIHHSFTIRIHSSCSRSFFSLLLVIF